MNSLCCVSRVHPVVPPYINNNSNSSSSPSGRHRNAQVLHDRAIARSLGYLFPNLETASHMDRRSGHGPEDRGSSGGQSSHPSSFVTHGNFEDYDFNVVRFQNVSASGSSSIRNPQNGIQVRLWTINGCLTFTGATQPCCQNLLRVLDTSTHDIHVLFLVSSMRSH